jgi:predicted nucleic acid-binding protein
VALERTLWNHTVDTTVLWGLSAAELLEEMCALAPGRLFVTPTVVEELTRNRVDFAHLQTALDAIAAGRIGGATLTKAETKLVFDIHTSLWRRRATDSRDLGEAECIAVAATRKWGAILDDKGRILMQMGYSTLPCSGTPAVLLDLVDAGRLTMDQAWEALKTMLTKGGFHHEFHEKTKADWMNCRKWLLPARL